MCCATPRLGTFPRGEQLSLTTSATHTAPNVADHRQRFELCNESSCDHVATCCNKPSRRQLMIQLSNTSGGDTKHVDVWNRRITEIRRTLLLGASHGPKRTRRGLIDLGGQIAKLFGTATVKDVEECERYTLRRRWDGSRTKFYLC